MHAYERLRWRGRQGRVTCLHLPQQAHIHKILYTDFFFFPHQRIFVNFQPCCILAVVKYEETGSCEITQVLSQNWRDASGSFVGSARPGFSSLFNVFCAHSHENSHFPRHPTDALLFFFFCFHPFSFVASAFYPKTSALVFKWPSGSSAHPLILFLLTQTV